MVFFYSPQVFLNDDSKTPKKQSSTCLGTENVLGFVFLHRAGNAILWTQKEKLITLPFLTQRFLRNYLLEDGLYF